MAGNAIVARLQLDSKEYEKKLEQAKRKTRDFSQGGGTSVDDLMGKFQALAGAVTACKAAQEVFNNVMNSSQTYADTYGNIMNTVNGTIDNVVYSLANADFSSFERGLRKVAEASWSASAALDQLWNTKQSASYFTNKNRERLAEMLNIAKDESKTAAQRKAAQDAIDAILKDQQEVVNTTRQDVDAAIYGMINQASGGRLQASDVDRAAVEAALRIDVSVDREQLKADLEEQYKVYREESAKIAEKYTSWETKTNAQGYIVSQSKVVSEEGQAALAALDAKYADIIVKYSVLEVMSDDQIANLISELNYAEQNEKILQKMVGQYIAINNQMNTPAKDGALLTGKETFEELIAIASNPSTNDKVRSAAYAAADNYVTAFAIATSEVEDEVKSLDLDALHINEADLGKEKLEELREKVAEVGAELASLGITARMTGEQIGRSFSVEYYDKINRTDLVKLRDESRNPVTGAYNAPIVEDVPIIDATLEEEDPLPALTTTAENMKAVEEQSYSTTDAINALGSAMSSLSGLVGEDAAAWLDWGANLMSTIASALPQLGALTAARATEATANTASAASGAGASVANIPYVGPILAVAAIASVLAAAAKIPKIQKFAQGGVVSGGLTAGDNVLIRANSGEVVLTKAQANNIGTLLGRGGRGGNVEFKIKGSTLVGVLNNYNHIAGRSYGN